MYNPDAINLTVISYSSNEAHCICPFHHDTKPSASFNLLTGLFYCFSCGTAHNAESLAFALNGTVEKIDSYSSSKASYSDERLWMKLIWNGLAHDNKYLKSRNVTDELVNIFQIRANENGVIFPIYDKRNKVCGVQIRQYVKKPKYLTFGEKTAVWPLHVELNHPDVMIICEGVFGAINCYRLGVSAYATLGAMMKREIQQFVFSPVVYGFFDNDFAGYVAGARLLSYIPRAKIIVPGGEIDNFSNVDLTQALYNREHTRYLPQLAELSGDKEKFYQYVPKG